MNQKVKNKDNNNSSNSLVFGRRQKIAQQLANSFSARKLGSLHLRGATVTLFASVAPTVLVIYIVVS